MQLPMLGGLLSKKEAPGLASATLPPSVGKTSAEATSGSGGSSGSGSSGNSTGTSGITSNDFLTLLVAEMKNQDPTSNTDPNQYIDQLVQVNSLQQLISINQELAPSSGTQSSGSGSGSGSGASTPAVAASQPVRAPEISAGAGLAERRGVPSGAVSTQAQIAASAARVAQALTPPADAAGVSGSGNTNSSQIRRFSLAARGGLAMQP